MKFALATSFLFALLFCSAHGVLEALTGGGPMEPPPPAFPPSASPPSALDCGQQIEMIPDSGQGGGQAEIEARVTGCIFGATPTCCDNFGILFKFGTGSPVAGCLCSELIFEETKRMIVENQQAQFVGFDEDKFEQVLLGCDINFFGGTGQSICPGIIPASQVPGNQDDDDDDGGRRRRVVRRQTGLLGLIG